MIYRVSIKQKSKILSASIVNNVEMLIRSPTTLFIFALFLDVFYQHTIKAARLPVRKTSGDRLRENGTPNGEDDGTFDKIVSDSLVSCKFNESNVHIVKA